MTSQNKEFKGRAQLALGLAIGPRSWTTEMCGRNPSPSQRTLHWLFKHDAHRDLDPTWRLLRTTRFAATSRRVGECRTTR